MDSKFIQWNEWNYKKNNHMWKETDTKDCIWFDFTYLGFPCDLAGRESACNEGDLGSVPELGRSPVEGKGYPLQYSGLENSPWGRKESDTTERLSLTSHLKADQWLPWAQGKGSLLKTKSSKWVLRVMELFYILTEVLFTCLYISAKTYWKESL